MGGSTACSWPANLWPRIAEPVNVCRGHFLLCVDARGCIEGPPVVETRIRPGDHRPPSMVMVVRFAAPQAIPVENVCLDGRQSDMIAPIQTAGDPEASLN